MPNTAASEDAADPDVLAKDLDRRARTSRRIGSFVLALAGIAGVASVTATLMLWHQLSGDPTLLPVELPEMTPTVLAAGGGAMLLLAAMLGTLSMKMTERAGDLAVRSSFLRLGAMPAPQSEADIRHAA